MMTLTISLKVKADFVCFLFFLTSSQLFRFFCLKMSLVSFIGAVMLNACCGFAGVSFFQKVSFGATESQ